MKKLVSGIKPTGNLTIGNYLGAIKEFVKLQDEYECYIFIADLHALTTYQDKEVLSNNIKNIIALYIACGLDPEKVTLFQQSDNLYHSFLSWVLECNSSLGELNRMTQYKDQISKGNKNINCGLYTYPVLMAADILLYDADIVPVGIDQKQHVELTRNLAERFNNKYGQTFKIPLPVINKETEKILDLQNPFQKMSKSDDNPKGSIYLLDDLKEIEKKIKSAVTDSGNKIIFDEKNKPGISNLLTIYSGLTGISIKALERQYQDSNYGTLKEDVARITVCTVREIQKNYQKIINSNIIEEILKKGKKKTNEIAKEKHEEIIKKLGLKI